MKKKIGSSKPIKKYAMAGTVTSGPGPTDSIPSGPKISPEILDKIKKRIGADKSEILPGPAYKPGSKTASQSTPWGDMPKPGPRRGSKIEGEYYKKGGSVGKSKKPKMSKGSSFGMLSVKKGIDNNPKPTAADRIAGAKMKKGGMVKSKKK